MISRRAVLATGGASIAILGGVGGYQVFGQSVAKAEQPWTDAKNGFGDDRLDILAYAILAPNPHNRQPWLIRFDSADEMTLFCDLDRVLPETDPPNRQITIGLGAFLELLRQAAAERGYRADITPFPDGEPFPILDDRPVASIRLAKDPNIETDPLFGLALQRRSVKEVFDADRPVSQDTLSELNALATGFAGTSDIQFDSTTERSDVDGLIDICKRGWLVELNTPRTHHESTRLTRIGAKEVNANPDGISLYGLFMEGMRLSGVLTRENMNDPASTAFSEGIKYYNGLIGSAQAFGWLTTATNTRADQLASGAAWIRYNLAATKQGLGMHPLSQVLQEFPEMDEMYAEFHDFVGVREPSRVQGLFRFGYANFPTPSPRWPLESRLIRA